MSIFLHFLQATSPEMRCVQHVTLTPALPHLPSSFSHFTRLSRQGSQARCLFTSFGLHALLAGVEAADIACDVMRITEFGRGRCYSVPKLYRNVVQGSIASIPACVEPK